MPAATTSARSSFSTIMNSTTSGSGANWRHSGAHHCGHLAGDRHERIASHGGAYRRCACSREAAEVAVQGGTRCWAAVLEVGLAHATEQCADLLNHDVAGLHFYTMNQSAPTLEILKRVALTNPLSNRDLAQDHRSQTQ